MNLKNTRKTTKKKAQEFSEMYFLNTLLQIQILYLMHAKERKRRVFVQTKVVL